MTIRYALVFFLLLAISQGLVEQSKKKNNKEKQNTQTESTNQPSSLAPSYEVKTKETVKTKKKKSVGKVTYDARDKFYDRMEQVAKDNRKAEKELQKPQYSDPSYFGHKKPPKRRPAGKIKYCKECGIRH